MRDENNQRGAHSSKVCDAVAAASAAQAEVGSSPRAPSSHVALRAATSPSYLCVKEREVDTCVPNVNHIDSKKKTFLKTEHSVDADRGYRRSVKLAVDMNVFCVLTSMIGYS